jgi:hypothetical protein
MHEYDVKRNHIDEDFQIYCIDERDLIDVESERNDSFLIQNQTCVVDSLQSRKLFDTLERMINCIVIDQYAFEFAIIVSWRREDIVAVWYRIRRNSDVVRED